jgi:hypothetical protein
MQSLGASGIMSGKGAMSMGGAAGGGATAGAGSGGSKSAGALGGAASGAKAGAMFGPWGMVIGGVIGGATGYLGASKAKKEAAHQKKMIEMQFKVASLQRAGDRLEIFNREGAGIAAKRGTGAGGWGGGSGSNKAIDRDRRAGLDRMQSRDDLQQKLLRRSRKTARKNTKRAARNSTYQSMLPNIKDIVSTMGKKGQPSTSLAGNTQTKASNSTANALSKSGAFSIMGGKP